MADFLELSVPLAEGYSAYARYWAADSPRGAVLYHHGIQSHCGWYAKSAQRLCEAGFCVLQYDRRGSGRNQFERGHAMSAEQLLEDARRARDELLRRSGFAEHHVLGVSWGGKLAVAAYVVDPAGVLSLSLVTPGLFPLVGVSRGEMARIGFAMLYEQRRLFDIPLDDAEFFTTVPRWKDFIATDPLTLRQCSASFFLASRRMDRTVARLRHAPSVPVHLLVAGDERIIDSPKTERFFRDLNWPRTRITRYEHARHSLEFEGDPEVYFRDLVDFVDNCVELAH
ncbi:MAG: alpha/beta fold hydrolase [Planctomycetes bacterium]|nr:alpha/beta fold hydrolase [Planctomycetota bacterium]